MKAGGRASTGGSAESRIMAQERTIVNDKLETAIAFDANGNVIGRQSGSENYVDTITLTEAEKLAVLTHNHPVQAGGSVAYFSGRDMVRLLTLGDNKAFKEFRMVTKDENGKAWSYKIGLGKSSRTEVRERLYADFGKSSGVVGAFKFLENRIGTNAYYNYKNNGVKLSVALDKAMKTEFDKLGIDYSRSPL